MSALTRFLDRHGMDENFRAKAGFLASAATIAAVALFTPIQSAAGEMYNGNRDSPIGGAGIADRIGMVAERVSDRLGDMKVISNKLHTLPELRYGNDGDLAARVVIEINNRLYQDTPHPQLADFDGTKLGLPPGLADAAEMEWAVRAINTQKDVLVEASEALQSIVEAYRMGSRRGVNNSLAVLDNVLANYQSNEVELKQTIVRSMQEMHTDYGWQPGYADY